MIQRVTKNDNMTMSDKEWYNEGQRVTASDNEWQRVVSLANFPFFLNKRRTYHEEAKRGTFKP